MNHPYAQNSRLADVLALIQVLSLDKHTHRSESGLNDELQGKPKSSEEWTKVAEEHPEFFRVKGEGTHTVSLVARHVLQKNENGVRELPADFVSKLISAAIELHDREIERKYHWKIYIPIVAGLFTILGVFLKSWLTNCPST